MTTPIDPQKSFVPHPKHQRWDKTFLGKHTKHLLITLAIVLGLGLIVGATSNLPASAQGLVTGRNDILIDQLVDRVGERALAEAVLASGEIDARQRAASNREQRHRGNRDRGRRGENRQRPNRSERGGFQFNVDLDDELERLGPERVYQIAVDAGLISQAEAAPLLSE